MTEVHHDLVPKLEEVGAAEHNGRVFGTLALGFGTLVRGVTAGRKLALIGRGRGDAVRSGVARGITCAQWKKMKLPCGGGETFPYLLFCSPSPSPFPSPLSCSSATRLSAKKSPSGFCPSCHWPFTREDRCKLTTTIRQYDQPSSPPRRQ